MAFVMVLFLAKKSVNDSFWGEEASNSSFWVTVPRMLIYGKIIMIPWGKS